MKWNLKWILLCGSLLSLSACQSSEKNSSRIEPNTEDSRLIFLSDYGAAGDGRTDDTARIQQALDSASANGTIYFEDRTYLIKRSLEVRVRGLQLKGPGRLVMRGGAQYAALRITANDVLVDSLRIVNPDGIEPDFVINGCGQSGDLATKHIVGIQVEASGTKILRSTFERMSYGIRLESGTEHQVEDNTIHQLIGTNAECDGGAGVYVASAFSTINGNLISQTNDKSSEGAVIVFGEQAIRNDISRNDISGNFINAIVVNNRIPVEEEALKIPTNLIFLNFIKSNGILIQNTQKTDVFDNEILFTQSATSTSSAIRVWNSRDSQIFRNVVTVDDEGSLDAALWLYQVPGADVYENIFQRSEFLENLHTLDYGIKMELSNDAKINNNLIAANLAQTGIGIYSSPRLSMTQTNRIRQVGLIGLKIENSDEASIRLLDIFRTGDFALQIKDSANLELVGLEIAEAQNGLHVRSSEMLSLRNSSLSFYETDKDFDESDQSYTEVNTEWSQIPQE